jgi:RNA polymerase sigma-70 factor (ECF subfamily)
VLLLRVIAGLTLAETAEVVSKSLGAVKALQRRGIAAIAREFSTEGVPF